MTVGKPGEESRMAAPATQRASELGNRPGKASCGLRPGFEHAGPYQISFPLRPCRAASCEDVCCAVLDIS